jgi:hypothetical protein
MPPAKHPRHVAKRIFDLLVADKVGANTLGLVNGDVFYGDQDKLPRTPAVCVQASDTTSPLDGVPRMVRRQHETIITVFHAGYDDNQTTELESQQFADAVADFLDGNMELRDAAGNDPLVIHGWVVSNAPGYMRVGDNKFRATRLTWQGVSKTQLGA